MKEYMSFVLLIKMRISLVALIKNIVSIHTLKLIFIRIKM